MKANAVSPAPEQGVVLLPLLSIVILAVCIASFTFAVLLSRHRFDQSYQWAESLEPVLFWLLAVATLLIGFAIGLSALHRAVRLHRGRILASVAVVLYCATAMSYVVLQMRYNW